MAKMAGTAMDSSTAKISRKYRDTSVSFALLLRTDFAPGLRIALLALLATLLLVALLDLLG
jgi:hypothetical protein